MDLDAKVRDVKALVVAGAFACFAFGFVSGVLVTKFVSN